MEINAVDETNKTLKDIGLRTTNGILHPIEHPHRLHNGDVNCIAREKSAYLGCR